MARLEAALEANENPPRHPGRRRTVAAPRCSVPSPARRHALRLSQPAAVTIFHPGACHAGRSCDPDRPAPADLPLVDGMGRRSVLLGPRAQPRRSDGQPGSGELRQPCLHYGMARLTRPSGEPKSNGPTGTKGVHCLRHRTATGKGLLETPVCDSPPLCNPPGARYDQRAATSCWRFSLPTECIPFLASVPRPALKTNASWP